MLEAKHVTKWYDHHGSPAVAAVSLNVQPGEFVCITGRSGSGKSTLLNLLSTLLEPDEGSVSYMGNDLARMPHAHIDGIRNSTFSMVFQMHHLLPYFTALENVCLPFMKGLGPVRREQKQRAEECLEHVGLAGKAARLPGQLSGGEQQRVAIARAMVTEPEVIFADEPTGSLDQANGAEVVRLLASLRDRGVSVVLVTHEPAYAQLADRHVVMEDGVVTDS